jgi:hypothetical protein
MTTEAREDSDAAERDAGAEGSGDDELGGSPEDAGVHRKAL